jgi:hypothetical protein
MTPKARRIFGGILLVIVGFSSAVASGFATYCIVASTGIGGLTPRIGPTGCEAYLTGVSALLTPTIAAIAAYIAYQQYQTARTKLRHDLYERRAGILRGVLVALGPVFRDGRVGGDVIPELIRATSEKDVLLDSDLCKYLDDLYRKIVYIYALQLQFQGLPDGRDRTRLVDEHAELLAWLTEQPIELRQRFLSYLRISDAEG